MSVLTLTSTTLHRRTTRDNKAEQVAQPTSRATHHLRVTPRDLPTARTQPDHPSVSSSCQPRRSVSHPQTGRHRAAGSPGSLLPRSITYTVVLSSEARLPYCRTVTLACVSVITCPCTRPYQLPDGRGFFQVYLTGPLDVCGTSRTSTRNTHQVARVPPTLVAILAVSRLEYPSRISVPPPQGPGAAGLVTSRISMSTFHPYFHRSTSVQPLSRKRTLDTSFVERLDGYDNADNNWGQRGRSRSD